ncbi:MAG TPA: penicillin-binding protein 2 [Bryobacteraceae bacterium]|jgi:penicillin-binding protein 2
MTTFEADQREQERENARLLKDDTGFAAGKIAFFQYLCVGVLLFLLFNFWDLQINNPDFYNERAERNRIRSVPTSAARGKIYDRDGRVIVDDHSSFKVRLLRENLEWAHLKPIADGLNLDYEELVAKVNRFSGAKYVPMPLKSDLTPGEVAFVVAHKGPNMLPELELIHGQQRLYPRGKLLAHVIGYVGEVTEKELNEPEFARFSQGDVVGKTGIEREYNDTLMGVDGQKQWIVDNLNYLRKELKEEKPAIPGKALQLTLDLDLQSVAELSLEDRTGAVVALDPRTGEVLAMVSRPAFDLNAFAGRIRTAVWDEIRNDPRGPMNNRCIQPFAPGSTFKPIAAMAGLESGVIDANTRFRCSGAVTFYGNTFHCLSMHGDIELHRAIVQSCDVYFYNLANRLGIDRLYEYADMAGFGRKTGIDLPDEKPGLMPNAKWKIRTFRQKWMGGETINAGIGQGAVAVTPLQLASAIGGLAMGGVWYKPHLVKGVDVGAPRVAQWNPDNIDQVVRGMYGVVNEGGTASAAALPGVDLCGKTGTAQVVSNETKEKYKQYADDFKDNGWFVGFAPHKNPEIVVAALIPGGGHGSYAAPIVRDIVKAYFDKKARQAGQHQAAEYKARIQAMLAFTLLGQGAAR